MEKHLTCTKQLRAAPRVPEASPPGGRRRGWLSPHPGQCHQRYGDCKALGSKAGGGHWGGSRAAWSCPRRSGKPPPGPAEEMEQHLGARQGAGGPTSQLALPRGAARDRRSPPRGPLPVLECPSGDVPGGVSCLPHVLHRLHRELAVRTRSRSGSLAVVTGTGLCHVGVLKPLCTHSAVDKDGCSGQRAPLQRNPSPQDDRLPVLREAAWV